MDDFLEPFLSTTSWTDANLHESSSWDNSAASQLDGILSERLSACGRNDSKLNSCIIPSDHIISSIHNTETNIDVQINSSIFLNPSLKYGLISDDNQLQRDIQDPLHIQDESDNGSFEMQHSFPLVMDGVSAGSFDPNHDSVLRKDCEETMYFQSFVDSHSNSTIPQLWQSYSTDPGLDMGQSGLQGLVLHGNFQSNSGILGKGSTNQELLQLGSFSRSLYENGMLPNSHLPSYIPTSVGMNIANSIGIQNNQHQSTSDSAKNLASNAAIDVPHPGGANVSGSNGVTKPRARARRGQATDPHSIAERLRREKIAERMKNLQELVPSSNKTDKASMLDEIIEYVKFLQLQVKVLSMSRLGAAGAVAPLITDIQSSGSRNLLFTSSADADLSETQEIVAFEQEVVKLMESNVTAAMQFLQTKGLCLMPVALASAISVRKGSMAAIPPKKSDGMVHSTISRGDEMSMDRQEGEHTENGCNRAAAKEEETKKSGNLRNLKSKA